MKGKVIQAKNLESRFFLGIFFEGGECQKYRILTLRRDPMGNIYLVASIFRWLPVERPEHCCHPSTCNSCSLISTARCVALTSCLQRSGHLNYFEHKIHDHHGCSQSFLTQIIQTAFTRGKGHMKSQGVTVTPFQSHSRHESMNSVPVTCCLL